jgi:polygalacturonase
VATAKNERAHNFRPNIFEMLRLEDTLIENITTVDSPRFNFHMEDMLNLEIRHVDIVTDVTKQTAIAQEHHETSLEKFGRALWDFDLNIPMFPFNTDGFDPAGKNIWIHDCTIENYDDAVAVKPSSSKDGVLRTCSEDVLVENIKVKYGVGMSIGYVRAKPPPFPSAAEAG